MAIPARSFALALCLLGLGQLRAAHAESIDTEHIFAFMIGTDVGEVGEREFQSTMGGRFARNGGSYRAVGQQFELELVPARNFRVEVGTKFAAHSIGSVPGLDDRNQVTWQGLSLDLRYRFLDRNRDPFGLTLALEIEGSRVDEVSGARARNLGTELTLALERDLIPKLAVATANLSYQPEWSHLADAPAGEQESRLGAAFGIMARVGQGLLLGGEARYFRKYEGIGLEEFAGQALFVGPTAYFRLSDHARLTASWSVQAWGRAAGSGAALDLVNFERHQAKLIFGLNF